MNAMLRHKKLVFIKYVIACNAFLSAISVSARQGTHLGRLAMSFGLGGISHGRFFPDPDLTDQIIKDKGEDWTGEVQKTVRYVEFGLSV